MGKNLLEIRAELEKEFKVGVKFVQPGLTKQYGVYVSDGNIEFNPYHCFYTSGGGIVYNVIKGIKATIL
jgi:hypothetical protein